jgi:hypothetical protein
MSLFGPREGNANDRETIDSVTFHVKFTFERVPKKKSRKRKRETDRSPKLFVQEGWKIHIAYA